MTTIGNNSLLMAEIGRIAEVAGYLWTKDGPKEMEEIYLLI